jgi:DNA-binding NarL/FixJ family response regulator
MHADETWVRQALQAGARGYLLKNVLDLELVAAIKRVAAGGTALDPEVSVSKSLKGERSHGLSARELEVLELIVAGKSSRECAEALGVSVNTVAVHRANIMDALGIHKTAQLVVYAIRNDLVRVP